MVTTTWEMIYAAPKLAADREKMLADLGAIKGQYTEMRIDWLDCGASVRVMVGDIQVFRRVAGDLQEFILEQISVEFIDDTVEGKLVLDDEEDEKSGIAFPI